MAFSPRFFRAVIGLTLLAFLAACAGTAFKWDDARKIEEGMTTSQVTQIVGTPNTVSARGDTLRYVWVWVNGLSGQTRTLVVDFKDGKVIKAPPIPAEFKD